MSIKGYSQEKVNRKSTQRRDGSGELDVFEATRYFSGCNEAAGYNGNLFSQKELREERQALGGRRMSLDMPSSASLPSQSHRVEQTKEKKYKQPSSPGGKLASFLNSLFNQAASKKKKSKSSSQSMKDEEEIPGGGRRKRRSSISLFQNISGNNDSRSLYASSTASGFRTPPAYIDTPTKAYKDPKSYSDHKYVVSLPKYIGKVNSVSSQDEAVDEKKNMDLSWLDDKFRFIDEFSEKDKNMFKTDRIYVDKFSSEKKNLFKKAVVDHEVDDGAESDSSSDLFELGNYNIGSYSNDLPVYETTHMESIKRGPPITNGPF
ncbi:Big grain 1-like e [Thalictrum thalictroides]|uniref:Big grain 1-like e n=1 Tax=Thalictrum thalictroides TaxID=46969 RepID=A0A7J6WI45_THATH|nr:Big grain 1-like e [Thalictrum thalictroides]